MMYLLLGIPLVILGVCSTAALVQGGRWDDRVAAAREAAAEDANARDRLPLCG